ncbi:hypothetical protein RvY_11984 [Ramazzottius varieornatus]|uniref:NADH dehydrogenase [ubiquinone] 1 alpha subcomplex subunit 8 n=1 Tax=Ramazzottius varieornatus TaxID=947166 RepID=A0A1D1VQM4_RAMVA|nr:hypothetical protein RvY_11984 [Ramazzottius varieornatus]
MVITKDVLLPTYDELAVEEIKLSSPALKAAATQVGKYCDDINKEFMLCRAEEKDPRRCLKEGKQVTECSLDFFRKIKKHCYRQFERHWHCVENQTPEMNPKYCRRSQAYFDHCVKEHLGQDPPVIGHFAQVRIHDSTRPKPNWQPIREYEPTPSLPEDYPKPDAAYGSRAFFYP